MSFEPSLLGGCSIHPAFRHRLRPSDLLGASFLPWWFNVSWHYAEDTGFNGISEKATEGGFPVLNREWVNCRYQVLVTVIVTFTRPVLRGCCHPMALEGANLGHHVSTDPLKV